MGPRLAFLFLIIFLFFGCATKQNPHPSEDSPSDASSTSKGVTKRYDKILGTVGNTLKEEYRTAKRDIIALKPNWKPFSTKKVDSAKDAVIEGKSTTGNVTSEKSPSETIAYIEGLEVEEVSALGKSSTFEVEGKKYKELWDISKRILEENFKIIESDEEKGTLKGDRRPFSDTWGEVVNVVINPANIESEKYSVEVVTNNKAASFTSGIQLDTLILSEP